MYSQSVSGKYSKSHFEVTPSSSCFVTVISWCSSQRFKLFDPRSTVTSIETVHEYIGTYLRSRQSSHYLTHHRHRWTRVAVWRPPFHFLWCQETERLTLESASDYDKDLDLTTVSWEERRMTYSRSAYIFWLKLTFTSCMEIGGKVYQVCRCNKGSQT